MKEQHQTEVFGRRKREKEDETEKIQCEDLISVKCQSGMKLRAKGIEKD